MDFYTQKKFIRVVSWENGHLIEMMLITENETQRNVYVVSSEVQRLTA
jgi:hypothetical protein